MTIPIHIEIMFSELPTFTLKTTRAGFFYVPYPLEQLENVFEYLLFYPMDAITGYEVFREFLKIETAICGGKRNGVYGLKAKEMLTVYEEELFNQFEINNSL